MITGTWYGADLIVHLILPYIAYWAPRFVNGHIGRIASEIFCFPSTRHPVGIL